MENTAGPTILKTPNLSETTSQISKNPKGFFRKNLILIIIAILVLAVLAEAAFGFLGIFSPSVTNNLNILQPKVNELSNASLTLIPDKSSYKVGDTVVVDVKLFTGGYTTDSTDLVVKYDPAFLRPQREAFISVGQIYSEYPPAQNEVKGGIGLIGISGITIPGTNSFSGVGSFARLNFTALKNGQTNLEIDYKEGSTADSNVVLVSTTKDILGSTENAQINISDALIPEASLPESCGSFTQYCQDVTGKVGTMTCNAGTIKDNSCAYDSRLTTSCSECKI